jgi:hypothetical protein
VTFVPGVTISGRLEHFGQRRERGRLRVSGHAAPHGLLRLNRRAARGTLGGRRVRAQLNARAAVSALAAQRERWPALGAR